MNIASPAVESISMVSASVPASLNSMLPPAASITMSAAESNVISPLLVDMVPASPSIFSTPPSVNLSVDGLNEYPFVLLTTLPAPVVLNKQ